MGAPSKPPLWSSNLLRLRGSLIAQAERIRAGEGHNTIKGTSLEVILRRTFRDYLPRYFTVGHGQAVNNKHELSPQLDVMVYDQNVFPHLAVNEDDSVIVCCESLFATVECKASWNGDVVEEHFKKFVQVESKRHSLFAHEAAAYFVVAFDSVNLLSESLSALEDDSRTIGIYSVEGDKSWHSPKEKEGFEECQGNGLEFLLRTLLDECMSRGQKDVGTFGTGHDVLQAYFAENFK